MTTVEALSVVREVRGDAVVVTSMSTAREWGGRWKPSELDFIHVPSSMGQTQSWALGIALAQPNRRVIACCGDGSLLMNLGSLVTIAEQRPANLSLLVFDNRAYEVTGGQPTPGHQQVKFDELARAAGIHRVDQFDDASDWRRAAPTTLFGDGPICIVLRVRCDPHGGAVGPLPPAIERAERFRWAITGGGSPAQQ